MHCYILIRNLLTLFACEMTAAFCILNSETVKSRTIRMLDYGGSNSHCDARNNVRLKRYARLQRCQIIEASLHVQINMVIVNYIPCLYMWAHTHSISSAVVTGWQYTVVHVYISESVLPIPLTCANRDPDETWIWTRHYSSATRSSRIKHLKHNFFCVYKNTLFGWYHKAIYNIQLCLVFHSSLNKSLCGVFSMVAL